MSVRNDGFDDDAEHEFQQDIRPNLGSNVIVLSDTTDYGEMSNDTRSDHYSEEDDHEEEEEQEQQDEERDDSELQDDMASESEFEEQERQDEERYDSELQDDRASESEFDGGSSEEDVQDPQPVPSLRLKRRRTPSPYLPASQQTLMPRGTLAKKRARSHLSENARQLSSDDDSMVSEYEGSRSILRPQTRPLTRSTRSSQAVPLNPASASMSAPLSRRSQRLHHVASKRDITGDTSNDSSVYEQDDKQEHDAELEDTVERGCIRESDASNRSSDDENQIIDDNNGNYLSYSDEEYDEEEEEEGANGESDEDVTTNFYKEQLDSHVGAPLPLTEPDELAFWV